MEQEFTQSDGSKKILWWREALLRNIHRGYLEPDIHIIQNARPRKTPMRCRSLQQLIKYRSRFIFPTIDKITSFHQSKIILGHRPRSYDHTKLDSTRTRLTWSGLKVCITYNIVDRIIFLSVMRTSQMINRPVRSLVLPKSCSMEILSIRPTL